MSRTSITSDDLTVDYSHTSEDGIDYWCVRDLWLPICGDLPLHPVPQGFVTDLASIPWWLWSIIGSPTDRKFVKAAVMHDFYCVKAHKEQDYSWRRIGDAFFPKLLMQAGVSDRKATRMYWGVWGNGVIHHDRLPVLRKIRQWTPRKESLS